MTSFLLSQGTACSWILGSMIVTVTVSGCAQSANRGGFCDTCFQYCKHGDAEEDEEEVVGKKKRHQSEQTTRVRREGLPETEMDLAPLVKDDSHVTSSRVRHVSGGSRRGSLVTTSDPVNSVPVTLSQCGCWCQGWCEVMVRRPSGVTSWVCR